MEQAKRAVGDFIGKSGHHNTTVHEKVAPAVTRETVNPHKHEEVQTAIDREVHQDHYHTTVQPVHDREILPEQHHHNIIPVEHREHHHGKDRDISTRLEQEAARFKHERHVADTKHTQEAKPSVVGEHKHHHVHEVIQPVVHKQTIQPNVVHTTVPIHEVHHNAPQHHAASALPAVSLADFKKQGGVLGGREERYDGFDGEPRSVGGALAGAGTHRSHHDGSAAHGVTGRHRTGSSSSSSSDEGRLNRKPVAAGAVGRHGMTGSAADGTHATSAPVKKPSLKARLDPRIDADGDGKKGFMS